MFFIGWQGRMTLGEDEQPNECGGIARIDMFSELTSLSALALARNSPIPEFSGSYPDSHVRTAIHPGNGYISSKSIGLGRVRAQNSDGASFSTHFVMFKCPGGFGPLVFDKSNEMPPSEASLNVFRCILKALSRSQNVSRQAKTWSGRAEVAVQAAINDINPPPALAYSVV